MRRTQRERSDATTGELLAAARERFALDGYAAASIDEMAAAAGVTKGALYHHFGGKKDLFQAVVEREQRRVGAVAREAFLAEADPWEGFEAGCRAFLRASAEPAAQRILLLDAPSVLGWDAIRNLNSNASFAATARGLERAMDAGRIPRQPIEPLAHLLFGAICEGANVIARSEDQEAALRGVLGALHRLLGALAA